MLKFIALLAAALLALPVPLLAQDAGAVLRIIEAQDQIVRIQAKTRHTTVIVLPASEDILDFRGGGFRVLAPDRSGQSRFPETDCGERYNERGLGL